MMLYKTMLGTIQMTNMICTLMPSSIKNLVGTTGSIAKILGKCVNGGCLGERLLQQPREGDQGPMMGGPHSGVATWAGVREP